MHSSEQVAQNSRNIREFGFTDPILAAQDGGILAGHARLIACEKAGRQARVIELEPRCCDVRLPLRTEGPTERADGRGVGAIVIESQASQRRREHGSLLILWRSTEAVRGFAAASFWAEAVL
jgi:hypothetical protein